MFTLFKKDPEQALLVVSDQTILPEFDDKIEALEVISSLVHQNADNPIQLRFAFELYTSMSHGNYTTCSYSLKKRFETLENNLYEGVRRVFWNNFVTFKNMYYSENLYASYKLFDSSRRYAFTEVDVDINDKYEIDPEQYKWTVKSEDRGKTFIFTNLYHNQVLYRSELKYNSWRNKVFVNRGQNSDVVGNEWIMQPQKDRVSFKILSANHNEYLFVGSYTSMINEREVYAWNGTESSWKGGENKKRLWKIQN